MIVGVKDGYGGENVWAGEKGRAALASTGHTEAEGDGRDTQQKDRVLGEKARQGVTDSQEERNEEQASGSERSEEEEEAGKTASTDRRDSLHYRVPERVLGKRPDQHRNPQEHELRCQGSEGCSPTPERGRRSRYDG